MKILLIVMGIFLVVLILVIIRSSWELNHFIVKEYSVFGNVEKNCKILLLSDLHCKEYGHDNKILIDKIKELSPDFICIAGDMVIGEKNASYEPAARLIKNLSVMWPVYYAFGNHEGRMAHNTEKYGEKMNEYLEDITNDIPENKLFILKNNSVAEVNHKDIVIKGVDLDDMYYKKFTSTSMDTDYLSGMLGENAKDKYNILIAHHPKYFNNYAEYGSNLVLSGHYHGGAVRIPNVGGVISTDYKIFPENDKGMFVKDETTMIVSGGLGGHTINIRLFNRPEVVVINLNGKDKAL